MDWNVIRWTNYVYHNGYNLRENKMIDGNNISNLDIFNRCTESYNMGETFLTLNLMLLLLIFIVLWILTFYIWKCNK